MSTAAATVVVLSLSLAGCSGSDSGSTTTLEFQTAIGSDSALFHALEAAAEEFTEQNPEIKIDVIPRASSYESDMKVRLAANDVPDILGTHGWSLARYSDFLEPLQAQPWNDDVNPALDDAMRGEGGEIYALPIVTAVAGMVVNYDVLDSVGATADDLTTWAGFTQVAQKVADAGIRPIVVGGKEGYPGNIADWMLAGYYDDASLEQLKGGTWVGQPYEDMLGQVAQWSEDELFNEDYSSATSDDMARALADAGAAFAFTGNGHITAALRYNPEANLGYIPVPTLEGGEPFLIGGEDVAYGTARDGENLTESIKFLDFLAEPDRISELASAHGDAPSLLTADVDLAGPIASSYQKYVVDSATVLKPYFDRVYLPNGMWSTLVTTTDAVITGQQQAADATTQVATEFATLSAQSN
ncbi:ABC transporter substrate-binding protein [Microbacterium sp. zg-Y818]|uniref:ABC transporter substrate-binding protein n=1 Tax=unclassified Microbacterium TaxID=2609290 RepID=UPI00214ABE65|nr:MULTISPECIES: ABC transporter substrate-binding protein [unclassified Microbacterium]MCR2802027.1 ABC transporter substrate-binding protein [Microbacterium sp. zg.Y818]WIM22579.1 ABC transporter substrate-binding protein [Microbacterium sp. zg-Y818]